MIIRVVRQRAGSEEFIGEFEAPQVPAPGDTFWNGTHGPYKVVERAFIFGKTDQSDRAEDAILTVKEVEKAVPGETISAAIKFAY